MARTRVHVILRPHYTHRIAVVRVEAIAELVDARRDLVEAHRHLRSYVRVDS